MVWKNPATNKDEVHVAGESGAFIVEFEDGFEILHMGNIGVKTMAISPGDSVES